MCDGVEDATTRRMDSGALVCLPKHPPKAPMVKRKGRSSCCLRKSLLLVVKRDTAREDVLMRAKYVSGNLERTGRERDVFVLWVIWERLCTSAAAYEIWERPVHLLTFEPTVAINTTRVENVVVDTESCSIPFLLLCLSFFSFRISLVHSWSVPTLSLNLIPLYHRQRRTRRRALARELHERLAPST